LFGTIFTENVEGGRKKGRRREGGGGRKEGVMTKQKKRMRDGVRRTLHPMVSIQWQAQRARLCRTELYTRYT
jgi:hypothetical protein